MFGRFEREVELAARLEHPHITRVYDSGLHTGGCYYAMEFVDGMPLDEYVRKGGLAPDAVLALMGKVCAAVQYAHQNGVIHRDLKPGNILVDDEGDPHVLDFGLAKALDEQRTALTLSMEGDILGTPHFMAPEQAQGHTTQTDTRTDVYSLGVILYHLLTGEFPHDTSGGAMDIVNRVAHEEPRRPRQFMPTIDTDTEAVLLKSLSREPDRRYATAGALADDIRAHLDGDPVTAQPPTLSYFLAKRLRKHRAAVAGAAVLLLLAIGAVAFYIHSVKAEQTRTAAEQVKTAAQRDRADENAEKATANAERAIANEQRARERAEEARRNLYFNRIALAQMAWEDGDPVRADEELNKCPVDQRHWEWRYLKGLTTQMQPRQVWRYGGVNAVAFSPDGKWIASACSGKPEIALQDRQTLWTARLLTGHEKPVFALEFSSDSTNLASGDAGGTIRVWDVATVTEVLGIEAHEGRITDLEFTSDGERLVSAGIDKIVRFWDVHKGAELLLIGDLKSHARELAITPDGKQLITAGANPDSRLRIWDTNTGTFLRTVGKRAAGGHGYRCVDISPDGDLVAAGGNFGVCVLELASDRPVADFKNASQVVKSVAERTARLDLGGFPNQGYRSGLDTVRGRRSYENETTVHGFCLEQDRDYMFEVEVHTQEGQAGITVTKDGKTLIDWHGPVGDIAARTWQVMHRPNQVALGNYNNEIVFSEATLEMLTGEAWLTRGPLRKDVLTFTQGERVDLLSHVDPPRHAVEGEWRMDSGELVIEAERDLSRLALPVVSRGSYELRAAFTRSASFHPHRAVGFLLPVGNRRVMLALDHGGNRVSGLATINGVGVGDTKNADNPTNVNPGQLEDGRRYQLTVHVITRGNAASVRVDLDGEEYLKWTGPLSAYDTRRSSDVSTPGVFGLNAAAVSVTFHKLELEMLDGRAYVLRGL